MKPRAELVDTRIEISQIENTLVLEKTPDGNPVFRVRSLLSSLEARTFARKLQILADELDALAANDSENGERQSSP